MNLHEYQAKEIFARYEERVLPRLATLRAAVLHQDANDNNIVVSGPGDATVTGLIDFGDMAHGRQINELAVTLAYALLDRPCIYKAALPLISAYAASFPIEAEEAEVLFDLVAMRLAASVCISSRRAREFPGNDYLLISQKPALALLDRLARTNPHLLAAFARHGAGLAPVPAHEAVVAHLASPELEPAPLFTVDLNRSGRMLLSLAEGAPGMEHAGDGRAYWSWLEARLAEAGASFAIGATERVFVEFAVLFGATAQQFDLFVIEQSAGDAVSVVVVIRDLCVVELHGWGAVLVRLVSWCGGGPRILWVAFGINVRRDRSE